MSISTDLSAPSPDRPALAAPREVATRRSAGHLRATLYRMHSWAGILVAPFLLIAALTGLAYAVAPTLEQAVYRDALTTSATGEHISATEAVAIARQSHPDLDLVGVQVSDREDATIRILFADPSLPSSSYKQAVFIDPVTGEVRGDMPQYGSSGSLPLRALLSEGHANLWLGEPGRFYSEMAASWLGAMTLTGLFLLFQRWRRSTSKKNRPRRWHSLVGLICVPGFLFLTLTGLTWSSTAGGNIGEIRTQLDWRRPTPDVTAAAPLVADAADSAPVGDAGADVAIAAARQAGLTGLLTATAPAEPEAPNTWSVAESTAQPWVFRYDAVAVDAATGAVVDTVPFASWPLPAKLTEWLIRAHMGILFGLLNQLVLVGLALALLASVVLGYIMWWRRGKGSSFGRLPAPRSWENVSRPALICFLFLVVIYGVIAPYFGLSMLAFLGVDAAWRAFRRRRAAR
ncbi:PepSY domain-containing protein [Corynebacterium sp. zg-331]|uniref:PepSY-associated TM helix domain-containing protein n=1 Tax=unclassified Corynebacterium TaxID=2624378 RepID=UPI00128E1A10|nr:MULTISPECIES: PepSY domain-containing protein [unclassified Corynebacterium]MBC3186923.1 PepSY domain-containing protein [Corynebacterium sp. zg-331]MPV53402.1 PepSY domain-containing protein [Corynebacterium sp. zg331]